MLRRVQIVEGNPGEKLLSIGETGHNSSTGAPECVFECVLQSTVPGRSSAMEGLPEEFLTTVKQRDKLSLK
jgi:hypothetical protein